MPAFVPVHPPRDPAECPAWLHEAIKRLNRAATSSFQSTAAIIRGEAPDSSGAPLLDLSLYFYKPGISGGQTAYGDTLASGKLVLSSTKSSGKGFIYLGDAKTSGFDEANSRVGISSAAPGAKLEIKQPGTTVGYGPTSLGGGTSALWLGDNGDSGSTRYTRVNETTFDDATYVQDQGNGPSLIFQGVLGAVPAQAPSATVSVRARVRWSGSDAGVAGVSLSMELSDGNGTTIHNTGNVSFKTAHQSGDTGFVQTLDFTLSGAEITAIANWTGMVISITGSGGGTGYVGTVYISWMQLQVAGTATAVDLVDLYDTNATLVSGFTSAGALFFKTGAAAGSWLKSDANGVASWGTPAALTKVDDTNVTLTLGASFATALLNTASLTLGWTGQLAVARGGTGASTALGGFNALSPLTTRGDLLTRDASNNVRIAVGAAGTVLTSNGTDPAWSLTLTGAILHQTTVNGTVPLTIRRRALADSAHLINFKDQSGTILSYFDTAGQFNGPVVLNVFQLLDAVTLSILTGNAQNQDGSQAIFFGKQAGGNAQLVGAAVNADGTTITRLRAQTASITATTIVTTNIAGVYRISFYVQCTTAGGADRTLDVTLYWTDDVGATNSQVVTAFSLAGTGRLKGTNQITVFAANASAIQYSTTVNGALGAPQYALDVQVEFLS